jgi:hypothetical protein
VTRDGDAVGGRIDQPQRAAVGRDDDPVRDVGVLDERRRTGHGVAVGLGADVVEGDRELDLTRGDTRQPLGLLLLRPAEPDRLGADERRQERAGDAALTPAAGEDGGVEQAEPEPVVLLVDRDREPTVLADGFPELGRVAVVVRVVVELAHRRQRKPVGEELPHRRLQRPLLIRKSKVHGLQSLPGKAENEF